MNNINNDFSQMKQILAEIQREEIFLGGKHWKRTNN